MEYPSNSHKAREGSAAPREEKKVDKVVVGEVTRRKASPFKQFRNMFVSADVGSVVGRVVLDVLVPATKDAISEAISQGIEWTLFGESRPGGRRSSRRGGGPSGYVSYNQFSRGQAERADPRGRDLDRRARSNHNFDEIILATRAEAQEVIDRLYDLVGTYEQATVADLYDLVGITHSYQDQKWGWTDMRDAGCSRVRNGSYLLDLPKPEPLA